MGTTAQESTITRQSRGTRCNRTIRSARQPRGTASGATPTRQRRAWLAKLDKAANQNERALLFWLDVVTRFHTDPVGNVPVTLKTIEWVTTDGPRLPALY